MYYTCVHTYKCVLCAGCTFVCMHVSKVTQTCTPKFFRLFYRALLQKRPIILRSLLIVATLYIDTILIQSYTDMDTPHSTHRTHRTHSYVCTHVYCTQSTRYINIVSIYRVATISRLLKITGLFCKRAL